ncbi:hypothetical protein JCM3775_000451 [Rhodotorula graminis]
MSTNLPDELLALIFDHLAADRAHLDTRRGTKLGFASACLASRRLRRLAQPVLWRQVEVRSAAQVDRVRRCAALSGLGGCVVVYRVLPARQGAPPLAVDKALEASAFLKNVEEVDLNPSLLETLDLGGLVPFSKLRRLSLAMYTISRSSSAAFATLEHLRLEDCNLPGSPSRPWLRHAQFPALRIVDLVDFEGNQFSTRPTLDDLFGVDMLGQLDYVYVQAWPVGPTAGTDLTRRAAPIFLHLWDAESHILPAFAICFVLDWSHLEEVLVADAAWLAKPTAAFAVPKPTLVLSTRIRAVAGTRPAVAIALARFETQCVAKSVRLVWVEERCSLAELFVLPEVQQLSRELRAAAAAQA